MGRNLDCYHCCLSIVGICCSLDEEALRVEGLIPLLQETEVWPIFTNSFRNVY